ncbi:MAG TPA: SRPBCC domain-containing protein [Solirubrobacteraceae bacterium]|nr:SRPBCC domain-containing protein [Solirubrobacteraceae bacterium]
MDRIPGPEPEVHAGEVDACVVVSALVCASADEAWRAATDPERVRLWFGTLSDKLEPGVRSRLDFEDGDFFDLEVVEVDPLRRRLRWTWRFMGCGPREDVEFSVAPQPDREDAATVEVRDCQAGRSREASLALGDGWRDFTSRLQRHLATGRRTRYDWRGDVDVWIELPVDVDVDAARRALIPAAASWLPLDAGENLFTAHALVLDDADADAWLAIEDVEPAGPGSVRFKARPSGLRRSTTCEIAIEPRGGRATLGISHCGFRELDAPDARCREYRVSCASLWLAAARRASEIVEATVAVPEPARDRLEAAGDCPLHGGATVAARARSGGAPQAGGAGGCPLHHISPRPT